MSPVPVPGSMPVRTSGSSATLHTAATQYTQHQPTLLLLALLTLLTVTVASLSWARAGRDRATHPDDDGASLRPELPRSS